MKSYKVGDVILLDKEDKEFIEKNNKTFDSLKEKMIDATNIIMQSCKDISEVFLHIMFFHKTNADIFSNIFSLIFWKTLEKKYEAENYNLTYNEKEDKLIVTGIKEVDENTDDENNLWNKISTDFLIPNEDKNEKKYTSEKEKVEEQQQFANMDDLLKHFNKKFENNDT
jgi:hypothetical protein